MGFKTKVQLIHRKDSQQWYINFPSACAQMMNFRKGEVMEWEFTVSRDLLLKRLGPSSARTSQKAGRNAGK